MSSSDNKESDINVKMGVQEAKLDILVNDFQESRAKTDKSLDAIFNQIRATGDKLVKCKNEIEKDMRDNYMSSNDAKLLEDRLTKDTKSIKLWIVSTVGGFFSAGVVILWLMNVGIIR